MNKKSRKRWFKHFSRNGKNWCNICNIRVYFSTNNLKTKPKGVVDHIDNDSSHNQAWNLQILCYPCNKIKNPSKKYEPKRVTTHSEHVNITTEKKWRRWLIKKILIGGSNGYELDEAIYSGSEIFDCSPETIERRYIKKMLSTAGQLKLIDDILFIKGMELESKLTNLLEKDFESANDSDININTYIDNLNNHRKRG